MSEYEGRHRITDNDEMWDRIADAAVLHVASPHTARHSTEEKAA